MTSPAQLSTIQLLMVPGKVLTTPCHTSRTRVDPSRRQAESQPAPKRKRSVMSKQQRCLPLAWLAMLPRTTSSFVMQGWSLLVLRRGWKVLSTGLPSSFQLAEHVLDFYRLSFSLVPRFLASKNGENLWMTNFFSFLLATLSPQSLLTLFWIADRRLVMLYGCQEGDPVTFTFRTQKVDQPFARPAFTLHTSFSLKNK